MSDSKHQVTKVKRAYKRRAQPDSDENCSPGNWNKPMNDWNNQGIRTPLGELSNNYMTTLTQNTNVFESSVKRKSREHSISYGNTDPINITRRNERERNRVKLLNMGFDRLRAVVPCHSGEQLSKISTLKKAIWYIEHLDKVLHGQENSSSDFISQSTSMPPPSVSTDSAIHPDSLKDQSKPIILPSLPTSAGLFEINRNEARSGTSWSSFEKGMSPIRNTSIQERRPVNQPYLSPIFPTYWDQNTNSSVINTCNSSKEMISTPKFTSTPNIMNAIKQVEATEVSLPSSSYSSSLSSSGYRNDSGYDSPVCRIRLLPELNHNPLSKWYQSRPSNYTAPTNEFPVIANPVFNSPVSSSDNQPTISKFTLSYNFPHLQWLLNDNYTYKSSGM